MPKHDNDLSGENWDGIKIEEHKEMDRKLTSPKSRWSWHMWSGGNSKAADYDEIYGKK